VLHQATVSSQDVRECWSCSISERSEGMVDHPGTIYREYIGHTGSYRAYREPIGLHHRGPWVHTRALHRMVLLRVTLRMDPPSGRPDDPMDAAHLQDALMLYRWWHRDAPHCTSIVRMWVSSTHHHLHRDALLLCSCGY
jgi:hypothetical protein